MSNKISWLFLMIQLIAGSIFLMRGLDKYIRPDYNIREFAGLQLSPSIMTVVAVFEVLGGAAIILGVGVRWWAGLFAMIMAGAVVTIGINTSFIGGYDFPLTMFALCILMFAAGNNNFSFYKLLFAKKQLSQQG